MTADALEQAPWNAPAADRALAEGVAKGVAPGFVAAVWDRREPGKFRATALGLRRSDPSPQPMQIGTIFDLASVTKIFTTATLAARLVERGWIDWTTPLQALLPDWPTKDIRLSHLLSHTAGLPWWKPLWEDLRARFSPAPLWSITVEERQREMRRLVTTTAPEARPGERAVYSDLTFLLLGFALEELLGIPLDQAVERHVWSPLGIAGASYRRVERDVEAGRDKNCAATERCPWRGGVLQGQVQDDNCWAMGGYGGHAGAFGRAADLMVFASEWLQGRVVGRETRSAAWSRVSTPAGCGRTLGWDTPTDGGSTGGAFSSASVGHLGFTGTSLWLDPEAGVAVALLSNRVHPSRENQLIREYRAEFHRAIRQDLLN